MPYPATPTLSVDAAHETDTLVVVALVTAGLPGLVGDCVSPGGGGGGADDPTGVVMSVLISAALSARL
jgi:hypothetical protein